MPTDTATTYTLVIPDFLPATLNQLLGLHWAERNRRKQSDAEFVYVYAAAAGIPRATGHRRVDLVITLEKGRRRPDRDAWWKVVLDSCVTAGLLVDDGPRWCTPGTVRYARGETATAITLTETEGDPDR
jgi:hypothetical protein